MKIFLLFLSFVVLQSAVTGQPLVKLKGITIVSQKTVVKNEFGTRDTVLNFYRVSNGKKQLLTKFHLYQDEGGDCNNRYWSTGKTEIRKDSLILLKHNLQQGQDPMPEWQKIIYRITSSGRLLLLSDELQMAGSPVWIRSDLKN